MDADPREGRLSRARIIRREGRAEQNGARQDAPEPTDPTPAYVRGRDFIARCIAGDPATRAEFVAEYTGLIRYAIAAVFRHRGITVERDQVDDLNQSILLSLFEADCRKLKMYEGRNQASFATFIRVCATRHTLDYLRHRRRRPAYAAEDDTGPDGRSLVADAVDPASGPEQRAAAGEGIEQLRNAVAALPAREQLLVRLHFVEGLGIPQVAGILGISENATHVLKSRVRSKLKNQIDWEQEDA